MFVNKNQILETLLKDQTSNYCLYCGWKGSENTMRLSYNAEYLVCECCIDHEDNADCVDFKCPCENIIP